MSSSGNSTALPPPSSSGSTSLPVSPPPESSTSSSITSQSPTTLPPSSSSSTSSSESTSSSPTSTSSSTPTTSSPSVSTSFEIVSPSSQSTLTVTSTSTSAPTDTSSSSTSTSSSSSTTSASAAPGLADPSGNGSGSGGLPEGGRIAIAVVIPIVTVAILIFVGLWYWKKRKARNSAAELRRKEMEEYGFNPNNDPTVPAVGVASANGDEVSTMRERDAGYRGWGTTSTTRKASTTMSSNPGMARSDSGGNGYKGQSSPTGNLTNSDGQSGDPLVRGGEEGIGALGAGPAVAAAASTNRGVNRGPSNASSAYSAANRSDVSALSDGPLPLGSPPYPQDYMYTDETQQSGWDGQPIIRDVSARRNTHIENPSIVPPQGNAGISQNF